MFLFINKIRNKKNFQYENNFIHFCFHRKRILSLTLGSNKMNHSHSPLVFWYSYSNIKWKGVTQSRLWQVHLLITASSTNITAFKRNHFYVRVYVSVIRFIILSSHKFSIYCECCNCFLLSESSSFFTESPSITLNYSSRPTFFILRDFNHVYW